MLKTSSFRKINFNLFFFKHLSLIPPVLRPSCPVPIMSSFSTLLYTSCPVSCIHTVILPFCLVLPSCLISLLSSISHVLNPSCPNSLLSSFSFCHVSTPALHPSCPASILSHICLQLTCPASIMSCICPFLHASCPEYILI